MVDEEEFKEWDRERDEQIEAFVEWLESTEIITEVSHRSNGIDFLIDDRLEVWPDPFEDDHLNTINRSSISTHVFAVSKMREHRFVEDTVIHLPPTRAELEDEIEETLDLPDRFVVHYGSRALGGIPAPEGVVTPHVQSTEHATFEETREAVESVLEVYATVYDDGEEAIKEQP